MNGLPNAVIITTEEEYDFVIGALKEMGHKPFQLGTEFRKGFITIEPRYMQLLRGSKLIADNYNAISFEDFKEVQSC